MLNDLREAKDAAKRYARKMGMSHREWHLEPISAEKFGAAMKQALYGQLGEKVPRGRLFGYLPYLYDDYRTAYERGEQHEN